MLFDRINWEKELILSPLEKEIWAVAPLAPVIASALSKIVPQVLPKALLFLLQIMQHILLLMQMITIYIKEIAMLLVIPGELF